MYRINNIIGRLVASTMVGTVILGVAASAHAADVTDRPQVTVKFADLNLATRDGAAELYSRIEAAANAVCPTAEKDLQSKVQRDSCIQKAVADALTQIPPSVTLISQSH
jgi:UrcA family protein